MQEPPTFGRKTNNPSQLGLRSSTSAPGEIITHNLNVYRLDHQSIDPLISRNKSTYTLYYIKVDPVKKIKRTV